MGKSKVQFDINEICSQIEEGVSQAAIAKSLNITAGRLSQFLSSSEENVKRSAYSRAMSAEAWLDKGIAALETALPRASGIDPAAARAYAQECARRAAIRNPQYRDKQDVNMSGSVGVVIKLAASDADL